MTRIVAVLLALVVVARVLRDRANDARPMPIDADDSDAVGEFVPMAAWDGNASKTIEGVGYQPVGGAYRATWPDGQSWTYIPDWGGMGSARTFVTDNRTGGT